MERQEIKKAFDEEYRDVVVTASLKEKTLNRINKMSQKKTVPVWLKSCAAIILVGCLCVIANTNGIKTVDVAENETGMVIDEGAITMGAVNDTNASLKMENTLRSNKKVYGMQESKIESFDKSSVEQTTKSMAPMMSLYNADMVAESVEEELLLNVGDSEELIIRVYPDAIKNGNVYIMGDINIKVSDGIIVEIY